MTAKYYLALGFEDSKKDSACYLNFELSIPRKTKIARESLMVNQHHSATTLIGILSEKREACMSTIWRKIRNYFSIIERKTLVQLSQCQEQCNGNRKTSKLYQMNVSR